MALIQDGSDAFLIGVLYEKCIFEPQPMVLKDVLIVILGKPASKTARIT